MRAVDTRLIVLVASIVLGVAVPVRAGESAGMLRASFVDPASPFDVVRYEWRWRTSAPMVSVTRVHAGAFATDTEVGLVGTVPYREAWVRLGACRERAVAEPVTGPHLVVEEDAAPPYYVPDPYGAGLPCMQVVRGLVDPVASLPPFRVAFWEDGAYGTIQTRTDDPAWLFVDDRPTLLRTPVTDLRVEPGQRRLRWERLMDGEVREATISVEAGQTTTIRIEFRREAPAETAPPAPPPLDAGVS